MGHSPFFFLLLFSLNLLLLLDIFIHFLLFLIFLFRCLSYRSCFSPVIYFPPCITPSLPLSLLALQLSLTSFSFILVSLYTPPSYRRPLHLSRFTSFSLLPLFPTHHFTPRPSHGLPVPLPLQSFPLPPTHLLGLLLSTPHCSPICSSSPFLFTSFLPPSLPISFFVPPFSVHVVSSLLLSRLPSLPVSLPSTSPQHGIYTHTHTLGCHKLGKSGEVKSYQGVV